MPPINRAQIMLGQSHEGPFSFPRLSPIPFSPQYPLSHPRCSLSFVVSSCAMGPSPSWSPTPPCPTLIGFNYTFNIFERYTLVLRRQSTTLWVNVCQSHCVPQFQPLLSPASALLPLSIRLRYVISNLGNVTHGISNNITQMTDTESCVCNKI